METRKAVQQLSSGKAPGADAIPAEGWGGGFMAEKLAELFHCMWRKEAIPQEFKDASIIHVYKREGNPQVCDNHRGVRQFHDGMHARVQNDGEFSEPFEVTNGIKQGCAMAPTLFSMMFSFMLMDANQDSDTGFPIRYCFDGNIFNLRRLQAKTKVQTDVLDELPYADDMDKNASSEAKMQRAMDQVSQSCNNYDLTISTKKDRGCTPAPGKPYNEPTITVKGQKLKVVDKFTYMGSTLSRAVHIDDEVTARIAKASVAFGRLRANVWELDTKLKVYKAVVLPTLLYACETWTVYQRHAKRLNHFHLSCLRKLLKIKWQDKIPDTEVLKKAGMQSMHTVLKLAQLKWTGHVITMPDERLPKKVFYGELQEGKCSQGGQKKPSKPL